MTKNGDKFQLVGFQATPFADRKKGINKLLVMGYRGSKQVKKLTSIVLSVNKTNQDRTPKRTQVSFAGWKDLTKVVVTSKGKKNPNKKFVLDDVVVKK